MSAPAAVVSLGDGREARVEGDQGLVHLVLREVVRGLGPAGLRRDDVEEFARRRRRAFAARRPSR